MSDNIYTAVNTGSTPEEARANVAEGLQTMATGAMEVFSALYDLLDLSGVESPLQGHVDLPDPAIFRVVDDVVVK